MGRNSLTAFSVVFTFLSPQSLAVQAPNGEIPYVDQSVFKLLASSSQNNVYASEGQDPLVVAVQTGNRSFLDESETERLEAREIRRSSVPEAVALFSAGTSPSGHDWSSRTEKVLENVETHFRIHRCGRRFVPTFIHLNRNDPCFYNVELLVWFSAIALLLLLGLVVVLSFLLWRAASSNAWADQENGSDQIAAMASRLTHAKQEGYIARLKLSGPAAVCGVALVAFGLPTSIVYAATKNDELLRETNSINYLGLVVILIALLPTDSKIIMTVAWIAIIAFLFEIYTCFQVAYLFYQKLGRASNPLYANFRMCEGSLFGIFLIVLNVYLMVNLYSSTMRSVLRRSRLAFGTYALLTVIRCLVTFIVILIANRMSWFTIPKTLAISFQTCVSLFTLIICFDERVTIFIQEMLTANSEKAMTAAGVSQLLCNENPIEIVARARETFMCVPADRLVREDMADNAPNPRLRALAERAQLGEVDIFLSHSWHDDAAAKWNAIQAWREAFKQDNHGREPKFWIDKYCIDQEQITDSLSCLPVWLAGCKKVVAFVGDTYLTRLWCVMEVFVFVEMELDSDNFDIVTISDRESLMSDIETYTISQAHCFTAADTDRLMHVIDAAGAGVANTLTTFVKKKFEEM